MSRNEETVRVEELVDASDEMVELSRQFLDAVRQSQRPDPSPHVDHMLVGAAAAAAMPLIEVALKSA
jgi:LmbE family N-acetylglucosaminyl deacetylase